MPQDGVAVPHPTGLLDGRLRRIVWACAGVACVTGATALVGWALDNEMLKGAFIARITIKANTAACMLLAGLALFLLERPKRGWIETFVGRLFAGALIAVGLATLAEHVFGWDFGIDQLLYREMPGALATVTPNRMGPPASLCFPLLGLALILLDVRGPRALRAPFQIPTLLVIVVSLLSLLGYLFHVQELFGIARFSGIAFNTALAFLILGIGILAARPTAGLMRRVVADDPGGIMIRRMLPAAVVFPIVIGWLRMLGQENGLYSLEFGRSLMIMVFILVFATLTWWTGGAMSRQATLLAEARSATQSSERRFRSLVTATTQIVWSADERGVASGDSASWRAYTGQSFEDWKGFGWLEAIHPDDREGALQSWESAVSGRRVFQAEYRLRRRDGEYRWMMARGVPVREESGRTVEWIGACTEVHEMKLAQDALREADRRKDEFLATLSHELRNPLAPIRNAIEFLKARGRLDPESEWSRDVIQRQVEHMARLLDDLLDVSRITRNRLELRRQRLPVAPILERSLETSRPWIEAAQHKLTVTLPAEELWIDADPLRIAQVVSNLLNNAAKYTERGGEIALEARREGSDLVVAVRDNGIGLLPSQLSHVFEMFAQAAPALQRSQGGLGIGLALVRGIVEAHGGRIEAKSEGLGCGSEFLVRLPIVSAPLRGASIEPPALRGSPSPLRVLVADDNDDALESLAMMLQLVGHEVHLAHDGAEAVEKVEQLRPDVALLDIGMPKMNGFTAARQIRALEGDHHVRLIALTGWGQPEDRERALEAGFDHHLVKPVEFADIARLLQPENPKLTV